MDQDGAKRIEKLFWWVRWVPAFILVVCAGAAFSLFAGIILIPLVLGCALTFVLEPLRDWFERRKIGRQPAVFLTLLTAGLLLVLVLAFVLPGLWSQGSGAVAKLPDVLEDASQQVEDGLTWVQAHLGPQALARFQASLDRLQENPTVVIEKAGRLLTRGVFGLVNIGASLVGLIIVPFFVFYMLRDLEDMGAAIMERVPSRNRPAASRLMDMAGAVMRSYVRGRIVEAFVLTVLYSTVLFFFQVPMWAAIGLLIGAFSLIPYMGVVTAYVLALTFSLFGGAGGGKLLALFLVITAIQFLDEYFLIPRLIGRRLKLHPIVVFVGIIVAGSLFGLLGMILVLPVLGLAKVILEFLDERYRQSSFYLAAAPYRAGGAEGEE